MIASIALVGGLVGGGVIAWSARRGAGASARATPIASLDAQRRHVRGRVVALDSTPSSVDGARCVYILRGEVEPVGILRDVRYDLLAHPFVLEDGSGRVFVDPRVCVVEAAAVHGEADLVIEHRIRVGEEVELEARFVRGPPGGRPYREHEALLHAESDPAHPPRLSACEEPLAEGLVGDGARLALRGAGAVIAVSALVISWLAG